LARWTQRIFGKDYLTIKIPVLKKSIQIIKGYGVRVFLNRTRQKIADKIKHWAVLIRTYGIGVFLLQIARRLRAFKIKDIPDNLRALSPYESWLEVNQWNTRREKLLKSELAKLKRPPLFSIVMPLYNPPLNFLGNAIDSVQNQVYQNWELCIGEDCSTNFEIRPFLENRMEKEARIKVIFRNENGNISEATNSAAKLAKGDFLVFMDHDDELTPDALAEIVLFVTQNPEVDVLYSDDDKINLAGSRINPQFKPDWSPELLLSFMYFSHIFCVRRELYKQVGGLRSVCDGSQDHDLALRVTEIARRIGHIPKILYHWRVRPGSTALSGNEKQHTFRAAQIALQDAVKRRKINAEVYRPEWAVRSGCGFYALAFQNKGPEVAIIIPTHNQFELLKRCIKSLEKTIYQNYRIYIIDNDSDDPGTIEYLNGMKHVVSRIPKPGGRFDFSFINNEAVKKTHEEYILFLNNATEVIKPAWLSQMMGYIQFEGVGVVGARLLFPDHRVQHAGVLLNMCNGLPVPAFKLLPDHDAGHMGFAKVTRNCAAVTAACMLTSRKVFSEVGGFDNSNFRDAYQDVDFCLKTRDKGYRIVYCADAELYHRESASVDRTTGNDPAEEAEFIKKYRNQIDPYYNPNFERISETFKIAARCLPPKNQQPLKTVMVTHNLNYEGAPQIQMDLAIRFKKMGIIQPVIVSPSDGPLRNLYENNRIPVEIIGPVFGPAIKNDYAVWLEGIASNFEKFRPDIIHANTILNFWAVEAANKLNVPSIWSIHESEEPFSQLSQLGTEALRNARRCLHYPYQVVFVAQSTKNLFSHLERHHNFYLINAILNKERFRERCGHIDRNDARKSLGLSENDIFIIIIGTVCERKGQIDLVKAISAMPTKSLKQCRFAIVGDRDSGYSRIMHRLAKKLPEVRRRQLQIIQETGAVGIYYSAADIFVCASRLESFPLVIQEAMFFQLPIITTSIFGISEQVRDGVSALFYPPGDIEKLIRHIEKLVNDHDLRKSLGQKAGIELNRLISFEHMADQYEQLFQEAWLSGGSRPNAKF
jgi:glycosyltransferase involved in cell wall biosynthesis